MSTERKLQLQPLNAEVESPQLGLEYINIVLGCCVVFSLANVHLQQVSLQKSFVSNLGRAAKSRASYKSHTAIAIVIAVVIVVNFRSPSISPRKTTQIPALENGWLRGLCAVRSALLGFFFQKYMWKRTGTNLDMLWLPLLLLWTGTRVAIIGDTAVVVLSIYSGTILAMSLVRISTVGEKTIQVLVLLIGSLF